MLRKKLWTTDHGPRTPRPALTLLELLVVVVILTTIVAAAIPIMSPAGDDRRLREASRGLNTFITGAQNRAIALKRPFGIALKRLSQDTNTDPDKGTNPNKDIHDDNGACLEVYYVEQPPPYAGFDANSRARVSLYTPSNRNLYGGLRPLVLIQFVTRGNANLASDDGLPAGWDADLFPDGMIRPRDIIEFNGTQYLLLSDTGDNDVTPLFSDPPANTYFRYDTGRDDPDKATQIVAMPINDTGQLINLKHDDRGFDVGTAAAVYLPYFTYPAPYKILRQAARTSDEPYQLPEGTAIDLRASGLGINDYFYVPEIYDNSKDVQIMFTPEGRVARLSFSRDPDDAQRFDDPVVDNIFLLVGKRENAPPPPANSDPALQAVPPGIPPEQLLKIRQPVNWLGAAARWVVIGSQSGRIVTVENAYVTLPEVTTAGAPEQRRNDQILTAREFTRQMRQLGGR
jgi:type II secretory pathway pseudopilin PulG